MTSFAEVPFKLVGPLETYLQSEIRFKIKAQISPVLDSSICIEFVADIVQAKQRVLLTEQKSRQAIISISADVMEAKLKLIAPNILTNVGSIEIGVDGTVIQRFIVYVERDKSGSLKRRVFLH